MERCPEMGWWGENARRERQAPRNRGDLRNELEIGRHKARVTESERETETEKRSREHERQKHRKIET